MDIYIYTYNHLHIYYDNTSVYVAAFIKKKNDYIYLIVVGRIDRLIGKQRSYHMIASGAATV